jgi:hypothetical protein
MCATTSKFKRGIFVAAASNCNPDFDLAFEEEKVEEFTSRGIPAVV